MPFVATIFITRPHFNHSLKSNDSVFQAMNYDEDMDAFSALLSDMSAWTMHKPVVCRTGALDVYSSGTECQSFSPPIIVRMRWFGANVHVFSHFTSCTYAARII